MEDVLVKLKETDCTISTLAVFGGLIVLKSVLQVLSSVYKTFLRPSKNLTKYGSWAVVTGATDGIGKAYAIGLAKCKKNILLISRTESKLQAVQKEITDMNLGVDVQYVVCDYSKFDDKAQSKVQEALTNVCKNDIGILINNVGQSYRYPRFFMELPNEEVGNLIEMNVQSTTWMTRFVLDGMVEKKKGGCVINISSASAMYPLPLLSQYSAAKSYVEKLTLGLNAEYAKHGIAVQTQVPFYVATKLAKMRKSFSVPTPEEYVTKALRFVGHSEPLVSPFWVHGVMGWVLDHLPNFLVVKIMMSMHLSIRKRGLKKDARLKKEG